MAEPGMEFQLIAGLGLAIFLLIFLVVKTKVHAIVALIIAASVSGLIGGMMPAEVITSITTGFGKTLSTIGLVIGFGVMMGRILEVSGAAEQMAYSLIRWVGKKREDWAMVLTGYIVSIPIFCDSAFVILTPLVKALARSSGKSVLTLGIALAGGLMLTHHAVPPTPGPLGVAGIYDVDLGLMILWGIVFTIPGMAVIVFYARAMGPRLERMIEADTGEDIAAAYRQFDTAAEARQKDLPSLGLAVLPLLLPIVLIFLNTIATTMVRISGDPALETNLLVQAMSFFGNPVIAVAIGLLVSIYTLLPGRPRDEVLGYMEQGVESAGIILLVTGAGGRLGFGPARQRCGRRDRPGGGGSCHPCRADPVCHQLSGAPDPGFGHGRDDHGRVDLGADPDEHAGREHGLCRTGGGHRVDGLRLFQRQLFLGHQPDAGRQAGQTPDAAVVGADHAGLGVVAGHAADLQRALWLIAQCRGPLRRPLLARRAFEKAHPRA